MQMTVVQSLIRSGIGWGICEVHAVTIEHVRDVVGVTVSTYVAPDSSLTSHGLPVELHAATAAAITLRQSPVAAHAAETGTTLSTNSQFDGSRVTGAPNPWGAWCVRPGAKTAQRIHRVRLYPRISLWSSIDFF